MSTRADTALRLLIVDDRVEDAEALASGLRNAGIAVRPLRPESDDDLGRIIGSQSPDVVIAARNSTVLPFAQVMQRIADSGRDLPVIALVDTLVEADYVDAIQSGATRRSSCWPACAKPGPIATRVAACAASRRACARPSAAATR
jgi:CheY-like chemotaxis protein